MTVCYTNHEREGGGRIGGRGLSWGWLHRSAYTQWLLERGESKQFLGPPRLAKNMRKKLLKIREIVESQEKHPRKDVNAPTVSFTHIKKIVTAFFN